ncbi:MAG: exodeoxyribonuclease VII small subunit [Verrucomicrobiales bacterium]|nr:exodeoxyribonuclease VII small subunit [Verrucomicrobiales bacterium]
MPKKSDSPAPVDSDLAFEEALSQLESLVQEMESDQVPLEELIENYEKGSRLYQVCEKRLDEAQGRIEIIRKNRNGETVLEPFGEEAAESENSSEADASQEHGELF